MQTKPYVVFLITLLSACVVVGASAQSAQPETTRTMKLADVRIRDPFILADAPTKTYYLIVSHGVVSGRGHNGVAALTSKDLETWQGPYSIFEVPDDFWGRQGVWAPEVHPYKGKYYLFTTFTSSERLAEQWRNWLPRVKRGSQVLVADSPLGPYKPFQNRAHTPSDMMTLDGTLWVEDGVPYMVYCHEWVQIKNGTVEMIRLKDDLSDVEGEPAVLFHGSEAPWSRMSKQYGSNVTDGPFLYRTRTGQLLMLWSSGGPSGYAEGIAVSQSGALKGPWTQIAEPLFKDDGGHGMIFRRFDGAPMLLLHQPNRGPRERARLFELEDTGDTIRIKTER